MMESIDLSPIIETGFFVSGENFDPYTCTPAFGIAPTAVSVRGEPRPGKRPPVATTSWCLTHERASYSIDDELQTLINQLWPKREAIRRFVELHSPKITFTSYVKIFSDRPLYCIKPDTLERMAYFKGEFCLDILDVSK